MKWIKNLKMKHFRLLKELATSGSLSDAARTSHTTQPALSKWLKELEADIGTPLFDRHARGLTPTDVGLMLISHAERLISEAERTEQNIESIAKGGSRVIYLGTSPAAAPNFVPSAMLVFLEKYPDVTLNIQEGTMNELLNLLELGKLDLVIGRMDNYRPQSSFSSRILYEERLTVVCKPSHPLCQFPSITWNDLYEYDWIAWPVGTPIRSKLDNALTAAGLKPAPVRVESSSQIANLWLLKYSNMLTVFSERVARHFTERGLVTALDFKLEEDVGAVGMCWRDDSLDDKLISQLIECFEHAGATERRLDNENAVKLAT